MTTVGYGDKTPRSISARLFTIVWIHIGIVLCGILTGSLTTIIIQNTTEKQWSMAGRNVGMLQNRIYDSYVIARNGGNGQRAQFCWEETSSIFNLVERLKEGEIDGFLLDQYTYWRWQSLLNVDPKDYILYYEDHNATSCGQIMEIEKVVRKRKWKTGEIKNQWVSNQHRICFLLRYQ